MKNRRENLYTSITTELEELWYQKHPQCSNQILQFAFNYDALQLSSSIYKSMQKKFNLPTLSNIAELRSSGIIDNMKTLAALKANSNISE